MNLQVTRGDRFPILKRSTEKDPDLRKRADVRSYLFWGEYGDVIFINDSGLLVDGRPVGLCLQRFTGQPEEQVLLAVLRAEELTENISALLGVHHLLEAP